jgi:hypothetical protein
MNTLLIAGKYLDQPRLVEKFAKTVPTLLITGGSILAANNIIKTPKQERKKTFIKNFSVIAATISSALIATRGIGQIKIGEKILLKGFEGLSKKIDLQKVSKEQEQLITNFLKNNKVSTNTAKVLQKAKKHFLNFSEIKTIFEDLYNKQSGKKFLDKLIPNPENIDSKHIFKEIKKLSLMGLIPIIGGIAGGIVGDKLTEKDWRNKIPDKIKEGSYQYLANIFLCNIGAGASLMLMEKAKITSKSARAIGMISGILATGVIGGSAIANLIGRTCIDPIVRRKHRHHNKKYIQNHNCQNKENCREIKNKGLYAERKPEALDIGLHVDDIATVAVLSGLKWIEPTLPVLYSISGYRAGIGYRN